MSGLHGSNPPETAVCYSIVICLTPYFLHRSNASAEMEGAMAVRINSGLLLNAYPPDAAGWRDRVRDHLLRLGPESRLNRFLAAASDSAVIRHAERATPAVIVEATRDGETCGFAEFHLRDDGSPGEIALSVDETSRRGGIGTKLFDSALDEARRLGARDVWIIFLRTNLAMRRIAERAGFVCLPDHDRSVVQARATIGAPAVAGGGPAVPRRTLLGWAARLLPSPLDLAARRA